MTKAKKNKNYKKKNPSTSLWRFQNSILTKIAKELLLKGEKNVALRSKQSLIITILIIDIINILDFSSDILVIKLCFLLISKLHF